MIVFISELNNQMSTKMGHNSMVTNPMRVNILSSFKNIIILSNHQNNMLKKSDNTFQECAINATRPNEFCLRIDSNTISCFVDS